MQQNPLMETAPATREHTWSRYWSTGVMHSCAGSYDATYSGAIGSFWRTAFLALPQDARVLDLACGNGPLAHLLLTLPERSDLRCEAVDLADIAPPWLADLTPEQRERVCFRGRCAVEQLPFPSASFQLVVSQWGLEYSDLDRSVPELLRVLAPAGRVQLLLHHEDALPVRLAAHEIEHMDWLQATHGFLDAATALLAPMAQAGTAEGRARLAADTDATAVRERFNDLQAELQARIDLGQCPDVLAEVRHRVSQVIGLTVQQGEAAGRSAITALSQDLADARLRLKELRDHAMDESKAAALAKRLTGSADYGLTPLVDRGQILGWSLTAEAGRGRGDRP